MAHLLKYLGNNIYPTIYVGDKMSILQSIRMAIATKLYQISYKLDKDLWQDD